MKFAVCILFSCLSACANTPQIDPNDPQQIARSVGVERDDFKDLLTIQGPVVANQASHAPGAPEVEEVALHAVKPKDRPARYFLDVTDYYDGDWRGFDQAFDIAGGKFHALVARHHAHCTLLCGYEEHLEIELTRDYLETHASDGLLMRLYGPGSVASAPFLVPAGYLRGFLRASAGHGLFARPAAQP